MSVPGNPRDRAYASARGALGEAKSPAYFDATAEQWDSSYDQPTLSGHLWRCRLETTVGVVGDGPGTLLEVGVGSGRLLARLAERSWTVTGIDAAQRMVELARARVPAAAERVTLARGEALPFADGRFDVVVAIGVLEYMDIETAVGELVRVLRRGGRAVIGVRSRRAPAIVWQRAVVRPVAHAVKRAVPFGRPVPERRPRLLSANYTSDLLGSVGLLLERVEDVGCAVLPDPLDHFAPRLAYRAAQCAERSRPLRRALGTYRVLLATKA